MAQAWNIFSIGRTKHDEDQLTEMLAWLVACVPAIGHVLVRAAFGEQVDGEVQCVTQSVITAGRLDAFLTGAGFGVVVESKIDSDFSEGQIDKYLAWLETEQADVPQLALLTLTKRPLSRQQDAALRGRSRVVGTARLWEDLHAEFEELATSLEDQLSIRLVEEFLEMLSEEGLIPMKPLTDSDLNSWQEAWMTAQRFHAFFGACGEAIREALGASTKTPGSNSAGYVYRDFIREDSVKVAVQLDASDEDRVSKSLARKVPVLWLAVEDSGSSDWPAIANRLDASVPPDWHATSRWWGRPRIWRYLDDVLGSGSFEEQQARLAEACRTALEWLKSARSPEAPS